MTRDPSRGEDPGGRERMRRACLGLPVDRPPVWLMRQAGRYLPEYREVRARTTFLEACRDASVAAELSLQPWRRFAPDAVIVFSDILLPLAGLGLELSFDPGPLVANPVRTVGDVERLRGDVASPLQATCEAIRKLRGELGGAAAVLGFAGAPWTLAAYATERRLTRDLRALVALSWTDEALVVRLLDRMAEVSAEALRLQSEAGADALQLFDTWAGVLDAQRWEALAGRALRAVLERLPAPHPPVIVYARAADHLLGGLARLGVDVVSLDWRTDLASAAERFGSEVSLQGNLDPSALFAPPERISALVHGLREAGSRARGHVLNLGHGVLPGTPVEGVAAFVEAARAPWR